MAKAAKRARKRENKVQARLQRVETVKRERRKRSVRSTLGIAVVVAAAVAGFSLLRSGGGEDTAADGKPTGPSGKVAGASGTDAAASCASDRPKAADTEKKTYDAPPRMAIDPAKRYSATITTSCGDIVVDLDPKAAPLAVNNFVFLARERFYDGLTWHRAVKGLVIQAGDPKADGTGGPGYSFTDELPGADYQPGDLAMANSGKDTNGSQFFVVTSTRPPPYPRNYTRFGKVTKGLDIARTIESLAPESGDGKPTKTIYIVKVAIAESDS